MSKLLSFLSERPNGLVRLMRKTLHGYLMDPCKNRLVKRDGFMLSLNYDSIVDRRVVRSNFYYEREQINYFFHEAEKRQTNIFLDVGAYFGYYSLLAARTGLFKEIHAIEPMPENHKRLLWHIKNNNYEDKIVAHQMAASDKKIKEKFIDQLATSRILKDKGVGREIQCDKIDEFFHYKNQSLAIKMDVEGHELQALKGANSLLTNNDVFLQVEISDKNVETIDFLYQQEFKMLRYIGQDFYFERKRLI